MSGEQTVAPVYEQMCHEIDGVGGRTAYGYIRVSTQQQNLERQVERMARLGITGDALFTDKASGKSLDRPGWEGLMGRVRCGDLIVVDSLDRLGRNYGAVTDVWRELVHERGVDISVLDLPFFDSRKFREMGDIGKCMEDVLLSMLAYVADSERKKIVERTRAGVAIAKANGKMRGGVRKRIDPERMAEAQRMLSDGSTRRAVASHLGVHPNTVANMLHDGRLVA